MKKLLSAAAFALIAAVIFVSCARPPEMTVDVIKTKDGTSIAVRNGTEQRSFSVKEGQSCEILVTVERESGALSVSILNEQSGEKIYSGSDIPTSRFSVIADEAGDYTIEIEVESFIGSYELEYSYTEN